MCITKDDNRYNISTNSLINFTNVPHCLFFKRALRDNAPFWKTHKISLSKQKYITKIWEQNNLKYFYAKEMHFTRKVFSRM